MVSCKVATRPVKPIPNTIKDTSIRALLEKAEEHYEKKQYRQAMMIYKELARLFDESTSESRASKQAMKSNELKMVILEAIKTKKDTSHIIQLFNEAKDALNSALEHEPFWAEYLISVGKLEKYSHDTYGCIVGKEDGYWSTFCGRVCRELGLLGLSPGMTMRLECSICGKDPKDCPHVSGEVYNGRIAIPVARDIRIDHTSIVPLPAQEGTYIQPNSLSEADLMRILPAKLVKDIIKGKKVLTCKDLIKAIRKHRLRGVYWKPS